MKESVLITGASGFLGRHLVEVMLQHGLEVYVAVRKTSNIDHLKHLGVSFVYLNLGNEAELGIDFKQKQYNYIIHAAGITKAATQQEYDEVNAEYTLNLAKAAKDNISSLKKFVFISSLAAVGPLKVTGDIIDEQTPFAPVTSYGRSKLKAEQYLASINIPSVILRPTAIYGPGDKEIFVVFKMLAKGWEVYIGKIEQQLSFIYAKDMAAVTAQAMLTRAQGAFNISDGEAYSRYQLAAYVKQFLPKKTTTIHVPLGLINGAVGVFERYNRLRKKAAMINKEKINELAAPNWICSIEKAKKELDFLPEYNLEKGVKETVEWYKENKWL